MLFKKRLVSNNNLHPYGMAGVPKTIDNDCRVLVASGPCTAAAAAATEEEGAVEVGRYKLTLA